MLPKISTVSKLRVFKPNMCMLTPSFIVHSHTSFRHSECKSAVAILCNNSSSHQCFCHQLHYQRKYQNCWFWALFVGEIVTCLFSRGLALRYYTNKAKFQNTTDKLLTRNVSDTQYALAASSNTGLGYKSYTNSAVTRPVSWALQSPLLLLQSCLSTWSKYLLKHTPSMLASLTS